MKMEKEIRSEIKATKKTIENGRKAYNKGTIPKESLMTLLIDCQSTLSTLSWVLGENDRYD